MRTSSAAPAGARPAGNAGQEPRPGRAGARLAASWPSPRRMAAWYAVFAVYAGVVAVVSGATYERSWGTWAVGAYAAASLASLAAIRWQSPGRDAALLASLAGALVAPLVWLASQAPPTPDVRVVSRAAALLLRHGTPYLPPDQIAHVAGPIAYNPYLPAMALFGMPKALGAPGVLGDSRLWLAAATIALFALALRIAGRPDTLRWTVFAVASPVVAFPLALGITDPPMLALICVALALLSRTSPGRAAPVWLAAIAIGVACAMKYTAWPALPVVGAMLAARDGVRSAVRCTAIAVATAAVLFAAFAPAALGSPTTLFQNTMLFPLGLTHAKTPAASPLPGHLLATLGPAGHMAAIGLLIAAGVAVAVSLVVRPPADTAAAARRLAVGLTLMFALSPATRFGYFAYPIGLGGWIILSGGAILPRRERARGSVAGYLPPAWLTLTKRSSSLHQEAAVTWPRAVGRWTRRVRPRSRLDSGSGAR